MDPRVPRPAPARLAEGARAGRRPHDLVVAPRRDPRPLAPEGLPLLELPRRHHAHREDEEGPAAGEVRPRRLEDRVPALRLPDLDLAGRYRGGTGGELLALRDLEGSRARLRAERCRARVRDPRALRRARGLSGRLGHRPEDPGFPRRRPPLVAPARSSRSPPGRSRLPATTSAARGSCAIRWSASSSSRSRKWRASA
jgi:hypothetical protein